ncbi:RIP metalloprotease RseP [[Clostridium] symbiosum]|nr:RIP metalloprotease RseP [[Clostridium] symbiosum]MBO1696010.1 RIP metalloprotease RseP [[Clostridium] symbiosum]MBT9783754.1 RIP metalloprotease RseP [[Clostridium] symbiosum]NSF82936.1 RIP metalloprotease RseP [[Clostridium] symbiosum]NSI96013.1 RIP metalloprotease RseP [[Clostridium] symbiosum]
MLVFGLIILFHEFGHFLLAKRGGICVVEFSLGMGPRLFSMVKGGTRYSLKLFPFGGSCMMLGEDEDLSDDDRDERAGKNIAGKAAYGEDEFKDTKAASHKEAEQTRSYAGVELAPGATGVTFNETSVWTRFLVIAAGPVFNFILAFVCAFFVISYVGYDPAEVYSVVEGYPAAEAGIEPGDVITQINGKNIKIYRDVLAYTSFHQGETLNLEYRRGNELHQAVIEPVYSAENGSYMMGISGGVYKKPESVFVTAKYSAYELRYWINLTFKSLGMIVKRQVKTDDIAGPVRIVSMIDSTVRESSEYGLMVVLVNLANMCVLLSANLGIMNLLPIPALDGGRLVFIILEALRGRPIDREKEGMIHMAGMAVLMVLMVFILFNDIRNML